MPEQLEYDIAGKWSDDFDASIKTESTRAKVILSACYLDALLRQLLTMILKPVVSSEDDPLFDGPQAPLSAFNAKIELASRLGAISQNTKKSLHLIRKIRNRFAHRLTSCDFSDPQIAAWNSELHKLNDHATEQRRASFSTGAVGDFEKSVSWLIFWLKSLVQQISTACPSCGLEMEHRVRLRAIGPDEEC